MSLFLESIFCLLWRNRKIEWLKMSFQNTEQCRSSIPFCCVGILYRSCGYCLGSALWGFIKLKGQIIACKVFVILDYFFFPPPNVQSNSENSYSASCHLLLCTGIQTSLCSGSSFALRAVRKNLPGVCYSVLLCF